MSRPANVSNYTERRRSFPTEALVLTRSGSDDGPVPHIVFEPLERERIQSVAAELEVTVDEFFADARTHLSDEQWVLLVDYARCCLRRALEIGSMLHAVVDEAAPTTPYLGRGRSSFVKAALGQWRDCFSPLPEIWRLAPVFEKVPGGEQRVKSEWAVLEVMAANRMFGAFEEEYTTFFRSTH